MARDGDRVPTEYSFGHRSTCNLDRTNNGVEEHVPQPNVIRVDLDSDKAIETTIRLHMLYFTHMRRM